MKFGKMLSYMSPAVGMATGMGIGKLMPYLSPGFGAATGKGPFSHLGGMSGMGGMGLLGSLMGGHGDGKPTGDMPPPPASMMPGQMGQVSSPMQSVPQGQPQMPTSFGQSGGMFGGGQNDLMAQLRQRMMMQGQFGGGY